MKLQTQQKWCLFLSLQPAPSHRQKPTLALMFWELYWADRHTLYSWFSLGFYLGESRQWCWDKASEMDCVCVKQKSIRVCQPRSLRHSHIQPIIRHLEYPMWEKDLVNIWNDVCGLWNWNYLAALCNWLTLVHLSVAALKWHRKGLFWDRLMQVWTQMQDLIFTKLLFGCKLSGCLGRSHYKHSCSAISSKKHTDPNLRFSICSKNSQTSELICKNQVFLTQKGFPSLARWLSACMTGSGATSVKHHRWYWLLLLWCSWARVAMCHRKWKKRIQEGKGRTFHTHAKLGNN